MFTKQTYTFVSPYVHKTTHSSVLTFSAFKNLHIRRSVVPHTYTFVSPDVYKPKHSSVLCSQTYTFVSPYVHKTTHSSVLTFSAFTNLHIRRSLRLQNYTFVSLFTFVKLQIRQSPRSQTYTFVGLYKGPHTPKHSSISAFTKINIRRFLDSQTYTFVNLISPKPPKFVGLYNSKHEGWASRQFTCRSLDTFKLYKFVTSIIIVACLYTHNL